MKKTLLFMFAMMVACVSSAVAQVNDKIVEAGNYKLHILKAGENVALVVEGCDAVALIDANTDAERVAQSVDKPVALRINGFQPQGEQVKAGDTVVKDGMIFHFPKGIDQAIVIGGKFFFSDRVPQPADVDNLATLSAAELDRMIVATKLAVKRGCQYYIDSKGNCSTLAEMKKVVSTLKVMKKRK